MEDLVRICKVCNCESLKCRICHIKSITENKALGDVASSQKRVTMQGLSLPEEDRFPAALQRILRVLLADSSQEQSVDSLNRLSSQVTTMQMNSFVRVVCKILGLKCFFSFCTDSLPKSIDKYFEHSTRVYISDLPIHQQLSSNAMKKNITNGN
ncbi:hypothetical protein POM88_054938 [Heracleum sosnowskyi]|uniref:Uncharacterized protein n=1 Tax=Heracleum sosnowskyi TaxID=360622 RepID=A0AAD8GM27_9APIA|nr:hypothetical protein POM88_054938 [Heracleum sosnowskyi]